MTSDERLKAIAEIGKDIPIPLTFGRNITLPIDDVEYAAQKALEARDALRRIREVASDQPFANSSQRRIWKAAADLCDKILAD